MTTDVETERREHIARVRGYVFAICNAFGLTDGDRHDVATQVLNREVTTWRSFSVQDYHRLADAMTGARAVASIYMNRRDQHEAERRAKLDLPNIPTQPTKEPSPS